MVEINNENGLIHAWLDEQVDKLPSVFQPEWKQQWNRWLRRRYGSTAALRRAWGIPDEPLGSELLFNADFARSTDGWILEQHESAEAAAAASEDVPAALRGARSARVTVAKPGTQSWHVRFEQGGLRVVAERPYTLVFWAKAEKACALGVTLEQNHAPWQNLGFRTTLGLTPQWQPFRFVPLLRQGDTAARLIFDPPVEAGICWLAGMSLRPGGSCGLEPDERLEDGTVRPVLRPRAGERTAAAQGDWLRFLSETEDHYWQTMYRFLKDELKVRSLVIIEPGPTLQDGWSAITLTVMEGEPGKPPSRWLITGTGYVENSKIGWKNAEKNSVGRNWGEAPSLVEGIPARISLPLPASRLKAWALDERGQRQTRMKVVADAHGHTRIVLGPEYRTLWYEVVAE